METTDLFADAVSGAAESSTQSAPENAGGTSASQSAAVQENTVNGAGKTANAKTARPGLLNTRDNDNTAESADGDAPKGDATAQRNPQGGQQTYTESDYDDVVSLPEGITPNEPLMGEFKALAAKAQIPPEMARKILDLEVRNQQAVLEQFVATQEEWRGQIEADPDFGGAKLEATVSEAKLALSAYDPDGALLPELERGGYGNHPGIIRFLARVGRQVKEDSVHTGREQKIDTRPLRDRLWPD